MSSLRINIDSIPIPEVREIIKIIDIVLSKLNFDYYLIGARARDFWFESINLPPRRFTLDIDYAVLVPDIDKLDEIINLSTNEYGFQKIIGVPHRMKFIKSDLLVDLLPFEDISLSEYVILADNEKTKISIIGFKEVYQQLLDDGYSEGELKIASLPGLCILKLLAWDDKPFERDKDIVDLANIIYHYFDFTMDEIYELHKDLFTDEFDTYRAGARVLGRHIKKITERNEKLNDKIITILSENVKDVYNSRIADIMAGELKKTVEFSISLLKEIIIGLND